MAVFLARMVMPRSRSRSFESMTRSATVSLSRKVPLWRSMASTSVVLPWSTWAMMAMLRILAFRSKTPQAYRLGLSTTLLWRRGSEAGDMTKQTCSAGILPAVPSASRPRAAGEEIEGQVSAVRTMFHVEHFVQVIMYVHKHMYKRGGADVIRSHNDRARVVVSD